MSEETNKELKSENIKLNNIDQITEMGFIFLEDDMPVTIRIDEVLKERGLSPADLSKMTGISRQNINSVMKGKMKPGIDFALKVSYVLDLPVENIFSLKENAWVSTAKSNEESTLFIDVVDLRIIDGKTKKEEVSKSEMEYYDTVEEKKLSEKQFNELLSEYLDDNLNITVVEMNDELDNDGRKLSQKSIEALAKETLRTTFEKRYIKIYRKLAKKVTPLVNPRKKL